MIRKSIATLLLLVFAVAGETVAQDQIKIGYMNMQEVMSQHPQRDSLETELNNFISEKNSVLEERARKYFQAVSEFENNKSSMSEEQRNTRESELATRQGELEQFRDNISNQIQQRQQQLLAPLLQEIDRAIAIVAERQGLDFVLNEKTGVGENIVYFSSQDNLNVTEEVIQQIKN